MKSKLIIYWSRRDFRLTDNPALTQASQRSQELKSPFLPLYSLDKKMIEDPKHAISYPRRYMLHSCLTSFAKNFKSFLVTDSCFEKAFADLAKIYELEVFCNDDIEPYSRLRDKTVKDTVEAAGGVFHRVAEIMTISLDTRSQTGTVYTIFTPFKNAVWNEFVSSKPLTQVTAEKIPSLTTSLEDEIIKCTNGFFLNNTTLKKIEWLLDPTWHVQVADNYALDILEFHKLPDLSRWNTDEKQVLEDASKWIKTRVANYTKSRDLLDTYDGTSRLSYALKWGIVSSRTLVELIARHATLEANGGAQTYVSELIWREFYKYILYHFPYVLDQEFLEKRRNIPWIEGEEAQKRFEAWVAGTTGFEIVDAAMKQIALTGWMHNRARMITASVLSKNLGIDWRWGQAYFRAALVDLDEASNNGGWQWSASVGVDPKPIRIFNPYTQEERFDKQRYYRNRWLGNREKIQPIVDYKQTRQEALLRYGLELNK